jgi:glutaredoxin
LKKLIIFGLLAFCGYKLYLYVSSAHDKGPVAADGTPVAQLFVGPGCDQPCNEVEEILRSRNVNYELIDISTSEGAKYGVTRFPLTKVGTQTVLGNARNDLIAALAEVYGDSVLTPGERMAMRDHFDANSKPLVVLYGTQWCGYCKRQRQYFADNNVSFADIDVEVSPSGKLAYNTLQGSGYPLLYVGYRRFEGYKEREILDAIAKL